MKTISSFLLTVFYLTTLFFFNTATFAQDSAQLNLPDGAKARLGKGTIEEIAYSPDGSQLAVGSSIGIWLYDTATDQEVSLLAAHTRIGSLAYSPDGTTIVSGSRSDQEVRLWDVATGARKNTLPINYVRSVAYSPDGTTIATVDWDSTVALWDVATGTRKNTLPIKAMSAIFHVFSMAYSPDGTTIATGGWDGTGGSDSTVALWDVATATLIRTLTVKQTSQISSIIFSPDGSTLAIGGREGDNAALTLWDVTTGTRKYTLTGHTSSVYSVAFSPDGATLASASWDKTVRLWDVSTGTFRNMLLNGSPVLSVAFSPDGATIATTNRDKTVRLWDVSTNTIRNTLTGYNGSVHSVVFNPDGTTLATGTWDTGVRLWDVSTIRLKKTLMGFSSDQFYSVAFSPDGATLAAGSSSFAVPLSDVTTGLLKNTFIGHGFDIYDVAFSPDGATLASASGDHTVRLWDAVSGERLNTLEHDNANWAVGSVAFSPDGSTIATTIGTPTVLLWDAVTGTLKNTLPGHTNYVSSVAFSPDGLTLASAGPREVRLWDVPTTTLKTTLKGRSSSVAFSPDGTTLASGSEREVHLWDMSTDTLKDTLTGHTSAIYSVTFSPDGGTLASGSADGTVLLWKLTPTTAPIGFTPPKIADQTFTVNTPSTPLVLPEATRGTAPYTYTLSEIPDGLAFNTATRELSGTPTTVGTTEVAYTVTDATGASAFLKFTISVNVSTMPSSWVYWEVWDAILRATPEGTHLQILVDGLNPGTRGIALDVTSGKMYWTDVSGKIQRANLDGSDVEDVITGLSEPSAIALDVAAGKMYWTVFGDGPRKIQRANLDGSNVENLVTGLVGSSGIALDVAAGKMYWTDLFRIQRANLDGSNVENLVTGSFFSAIALDVSNNKMYWSKTVGAANIQRANLDGSKVEDLVTGLDAPLGLALDVAGGKMYWTDLNADKIQRANLDGSNLETLFTDQNASGIALRIPQPDGLLSFSPNVIANQTFTVGTPVNLFLPVATAGTAPYGYTLSPIPDGLVFDASARELRGTPTTVMNATPITYTTTDATGASASLTFTIEVIGDAPGPGPLDVNGDGQVTVIDLAIVALFYGTQVPAGGSLPADVNADGVVNVLDLIAVAQAIDAANDGISLQAVAAAQIEAVAEAPNALSFGTLAYRNVAAALADARLDTRIPETALEELLRLLSERIAIPEQTVLLPNYPNPFNPETWLPYELATPASVKLSIYSVAGRLVRTLDVGHQPAGVYQSKHRAAYWDGKNQRGEPVASGVYFYTLTAGEFTATRKLLIAK